MTTFCSKVKKAHIKAKALQIYNELRQNTELPPFTASNGWLQRFEIRHGIASKSTGLHHYKPGLAKYKKTYGKFRTKGKNVETDVISGLKAFYTNFQELINRGGKTHTLLDIL